MKVIEKIDNNPDEILYPHLKITDENFPRLLATRKILNSRNEYFGAFLPVTNVRLWLYQLNKIFRLRSCTIEIDGNFAEPCQMYFNKKCLAPCVKEICSRENYLEAVHGLELFLQDENQKFEEFIAQKIENCAERLDFEKAAGWRDLLRDARLLNNNRKWQITLENAVDTYSLETVENQSIVHLVTSRGRKFIGNFEFIFDRSKNLGSAEIFETIFSRFYGFHVPKEIRLPEKLADGRKLKAMLMKKFGHPVKISFYRNDLNMTAEFRLKRTQMEFNLKKIDRKLSPDEIRASLQEIFDLPCHPERIECFDVAHISNRNFVAAFAVWENGKIRPELAQHFVLDVYSELEAMRLGLRERLKTGTPLPDLIIVDGGKSQLTVALDELKVSHAANISIISAVKPRGHHSGISHLLTADRKIIEFVEGHRVFELIRALRDEAHRTANDLYRQLHENRNIFNRDLPLVPVRFDEPGGEAEDLIPIRSVLK